MDSQVGALRGPLQQPVRVLVGASLPGRFSPLQEAHLAHVRYWSDRVAAVPGEEPEERAHASAFIRLNHSRPDPGAFRDGARIISQALTENSSASTAGWTSER